MSWVTRAFDAFRFPITICPENGRTQTNIPLDIRRNLSCSYRVQNADLRSRHLLVIPPHSFCTAFWAPRRRRLAVRVMPELTRTIMMQEVRQSETPPGTESNWITHLPKCLRLFETGNNNKPRDFPNSPRRPSDFGRTSVSF